jgi:hypothetical protein
MNNKMRIIKLVEEDNLELNEKTKKEIELSKKNRNLISHEEVKRRLGL